MNLKRYLPVRKHTSQLSDQPAQFVGEQLQLACLDLYQEVMLHNSLHVIPEVFKQPQWLNKLPQMVRFIALLSDQSPMGPSTSTNSMLPLIHDYYIGQPFDQLPHFFSSLLQLAQLQELDDRHTDYQQWFATSEQALQAILQLKNTQDATTRFGVFIALQLWGQSSIWYKTSAYLLMLQPTKVTTDFFAQAQRCTLKDQLSDWLVNQQSLQQLQPSLQVAQQVLDAIEAFWLGLALESTVH